MSAPILKRVASCSGQQSHYKVEVPATSEEHAIAFVEGALARGLNLDATPYDGDYDVVSADEISSSRKDSTMKLAIDRPSESRLPRICFTYFTSSILLTRAVVKESWSHSRL
jgi:hypothetical protein